MWSSFHFGFNITFFYISLWEGKDSRCQTQGFSRWTCQVLFTESVTAVTEPELKFPLFLELKTQSFSHLRVNKLRVNTKPAFWNGPQKNNEILRKKCPGRIIFSMGFKWKPSFDVCSQTCWGLNCRPCEWQSAGSTTEPLQPDNKHVSVSSTDERVSCKQISAVGFEPSVCCTITAWFSPSCLLHSAVLPDALSVLVSWADQRFSEVLVWSGVSQVIRGCWVHLWCSPSAGCRSPAQVFVCFRESTPSGSSAFSVWGEDQSRVWTVFILFVSPDQWLPRHLWFLGPILGNSAKHFLPEQLKKCPPAD